MPSQNDPTREMLQLTIVRLKFNANKNDWEPAESTFPCQLPGCTISPWHTHTRFYESNRAGSPSHKFVLSAKSALMGNFNSANDLLHKRFTWEEEIWPARVNPQTGIKGKDQYYYFIRALLGTGPTHTEEESDITPIATTQPLPVATETQASPTPPPTNGEVTGAEGRPLTINDAALLLVPSMEGKTKAEVQRIIMQDDTIRSVPGFLVKFMQNEVTKQLKDENFITEDANGVYHVVVS